MNPISITTEQQALIQLAPVDDKGKPAKLNGPATFTADDPAATVTVGTDGLSATIVPSKDGPLTISIVGNADLDSSGTPDDITDTLVITVTDPLATNLNGTVTVQDQP